MRGVRRTAGRVSRGAPGSPYTSEANTMTEPPSPWLLAGVALAALLATLVSGLSGGPGAGPPP